MCASINLDIQDKLSMSKCTPMIAFDGIGKIQFVKCGQWSCDDCGKHNARLWAWRVRLELTQHEAIWRMWTITLGSKYRTPKKAFADWPKLWNKFRMRIQRHYEKVDGKGWKWTYCAFVEGQQERDGMPHFHIITNIIPPPTYRKGRKKPSYRLKDFAVSCGFGYQAKDRVVESKEAANYVAKYASKGDPNMPKGFRRVRVSQKWAKLPDYQGKTLLLKSKAESVTHFLFRVHDLTGIELDVLYERYLTATEDRLA